MAKSTRAEIVIFRPWRRYPHTNQILWARDYGKRAWRMVVKPGKKA